jgi:hypothetical protein
MGIRKAIDPSKGEYLMIPRSSLRDEIEWLIRERKIEQPISWRTGEPWRPSEREWLKTLMVICCGAAQWSKEEIHSAWTVALKDIKAAIESFEAQACIVINSHNNRNS